MEATWMSIDKWMDKEVVVHIYNGILLGHKREYIWVSSNEVDKPRAYYTEWSKSEREEQISYIKAYIWNLERWFWCTYLQGSNGDADLENRLVDSVREGEGGTNWESSTETYIWNIHMIICQTDSQWEFAVWCKELKPNALWQPKGVGQVGGRFRTEGICVYLWLIHVNVW